MTGFRGDEDDPIERNHLGYKHLLDQEWRDPLQMRPLPRPQRGESRFKPSKKKWKPQTEPETVKD
jgi:hypothetical protein